MHPRFVCAWMRSAVAAQTRSMTDLLNNEAVASPADGATEREDLTKRPDYLLRGRAAPANQSVRPLPARSTADRDAMARTFPRT